MHLFAVFVKAERLVDKKSFVNQLFMLVLIKAAAGGRQVVESFYSVTFRCIPAQTHLNPTA